MATWTLAPMLCFRPAKKKPCKRDISSFLKSTNEDTSSLASKTARDDSSGSNRKNESEPPTSTKKRSRKFLPHWKDDFPWIIYDEEESVIICEYCKHFVLTTPGKSEFVKGCKTFKRETKKKHSESFLHMRAHDSYLAKQKAEEDRPIFKSFVIMKNKCDEEQRKDVAMKINTAYFIAKEELPFTKFPKLLDLQRKNGLQIGERYSADKKCAEMVSTINKTS